jgi:hypothetical protein
MNTLTLPEVIIPELEKDLLEYLENPETIRVAKDIPDADMVIDKLAADLKAAGEDTAWLSAVNEFTHEEKIKWLLSLPDVKRNLSCLGVLTLITVYLTVMILVAHSAAGEPIYQKKVVPQQVQKCVPKKSGQQ